MKVLKKPVHFQWDKGNSSKNLNKHGVHDNECEEAFFDPHKKILQDKKHSILPEKRYILLGRTGAGRLLFLVFTIRGSSIRIISARDLNHKERTLYGKKAT
ncbi:MAG TPA: BrnT family toxin [Candidatus Andersenbacteria bacterium]|nr:BrnT family toxin [Candidatus Andersenbacteria bacterium]